MRPGWAICIAALFAATPARAQFLPDGMRPMPANRRPSFLATFATAGAYSSITPSAGPAFSCARTSTATYQPTATTLATAASNTCRVDYRGLLIEEGRTNLAIQSSNFSSTAWAKSNVTVTAGSTAPDGTTNASQIATTVAGGSILQAFISGTTMHAWSVWSRTASGTQATEMRLFDVTTGADICTDTTTATTTLRRYTCHGTETASGHTLRTFVEPGGRSGSGTTIDWGAQLEVGAYSTSYIDSPDGGVARAPDEIDTGAIKLSTTPSLSMQWTAEGLPPSGSTMVLMHPTDGTHGWTLSVNPDGTATCAYDSNTGSSRAAITPGTASNVTCSYDGSNIEVCIDTSCAVTPASFAPVSDFTHNYVGWDGTGNWMGGYVSGICEAKTSHLCAQVVGHYIASLGDSLTEGRFAPSPHWTDAVATALGPTWINDNWGVYGDYASNMVTRYTTDVQGKGYQYMILLAGTNDLQRGDTNATVEANLEAIIDEALADHLLVKWITILPRQATFAARITAVNGVVTTYCNAHPGCTVIDAYPQFLDPDTNALLAEYDHGDQLHLNQDGSDFLATLIEAVFP